MKDPEKRPTDRPDPDAAAAETPGAEGVGPRRSAAEAARLQDQNQAQRAVESGQD